MEEGASDSNLIGPKIPIIVVLVPAEGPRLP